MMKKKRGFTLLEVLIALAMFSTASVVIFSVFISNNNNIEIMGEETFLYQEVDRGIENLSGRLRGITELKEIESTDPQDTLLKFEFYYRDNDNLSTGILYRVQEDGQYKLMLKEIKDGTTSVRTMMAKLEKIEIKLLDDSGVVVSNLSGAKSVQIDYEAAVQYRKLKRKKSDSIVLKMRNIGN